MLSFIWFAPVRPALVTGAETTRAWKTTSKTAFWGTNLSPVGPVPRVKVSERAPVETVQGACEASVPSTADPGT